MSLIDLPLAFGLVGLVFYTVLGGADFGAGLWQFVRGKHAEEDHDHATHAMGPVWEANHVWLVFALTVVWTGYPIVFASIASTLAVPLLIALFGIVVRGTAYALRALQGNPFERLLQVVFSSASLVAPLALGMAVGGIASGRVPPGNAAGDLWTSWLNTTSVVVGVLAVVTAAYVAAVFLAADARRRGEAGLEERFRRRALRAGVVAGALAIGAVGVMHESAPRIFHGLAHGRALPALVVSLVAGAATLALVRARRYELARYGASLAVAAVVAGWALAQLPTVLPGLTLKEAAAPRATLVSLVVAIVAGGVIVFPALGLLFRLVLTGRFDRHVAAELPSAVLASSLRTGLIGRVALALFVVGFGLTSVADTPWAHGIGVPSLLLSVAFGFVALLSRPAA